MPSPLQIEQIEQAVESYLDSMGYELVDVRIAGSIGNPMIEVYCDIEGGINAGDCAKIARSLRIRLTADGFLDDSQGLIVSSPGLNRVLKRPADFEKYTGRKVKIVLNEEINGRKRLNGVISGYQNGTVHISETEEGDVALSPGRWKEIRLVPDYPEGFK